MPAKTSGGTVAATQLLPFLTPSPRGFELGVVGAF
jgi:hypothetical protein